LDCGSGSGIFLYFLQRHGFAKVYGVDLSPQMIDLQKSALGITSLYEDALQHLRNSSASFELIALLIFWNTLRDKRPLNFSLSQHKKLQLQDGFFCRCPMWQILLTIEYSCRSSRGVPLAVFHARGYCTA